MLIKAINFGSVIPIPPFPYKIKTHLQRFTAWNQG